MQCYVHYFGELPREFSLPQGKNDCPEIDDSPLLDQDEITIYQLLIVELRWAATIRHFNISAAVVTMSRIRVAPRRGLLD